MPNKYWPYMTQEEKDKYTDSQKLAYLIQSIKDIVPYVNATIVQNNSFEPGSLIGVAFHRGRADSSYDQLDNLLKVAKEMEEPKQHDLLLLKIKETMNLANSLTKDEKDKYAKFIEELMKAKDWL